MKETTKQENKKKREDADSLNAYSVPEIILATSYI